jgi:hypothetical protein
MNGDGDWNADASGYDLPSLQAPEVTATAVLPKAELLALSAGVGSAANAYNSDIRVIKSGVVDHAMYYNGIPYYTSDNHQPLYDMGYTSGKNYGAWVPLKVKTSYADAYSTGADTRLEINSEHGPCLGFSSDDGLGNWGKHMCTKRNCCGTMGVGGVWYNGGGWSGANVHATAWIKTSLDAAAAPVHVSGTANNPAFSCKDLLDTTPGTPSGAYWIQPASALRLVYCDMTTDGGGWTMAHKVTTLATHCAAPITRVSPQSA